MKATKRKGGPRGIDWDSQPLGKLTDVALAKRLGVARSSVISARRVRGIEPFVVGRPKGREPARAPANVVPLAPVEKAAPPGHPAIAALADELRKAEADAAAAAERVNRIRRTIAEVRSLLGLDAAERKAS